MLQAGATACPPGQTDRGAGGVALQAGAAACPPGQTDRGDTEQVGEMADADGRDLSAGCDCGNSQSWKPGSIEQRARAWEAALKATIWWIQDPSTYSKGQIFALQTAGFPPPLLTCCMGLRSHRFLVLYSATHPSTSMLHGSHRRPPLPAIFRHPPLRHPHFRPHIIEPHNSLTYKIFGLYN